MLPRRRLTAQGGYTIIEVLIAMAVLVIVSQAFALIVRAAGKQGVESRNKAEATEHAIQMLEELRNIVTDDNASIKTLDLYADGRDPSGTPYYKFTLTTKKDITSPGGNTLPDYSTASNKLSGNYVGPKGYEFIRHVDILPDPNDKNLRKIHVRIWEAQANSATSPNAIPANSKIPLAEVFGTVRSLATGTTPTQVMDVYLIALENVPGWWSRTSNLIPLMRASLISLQSRNPGLVIRPHWIRRISYGRDVEYTPEINSTLRADANNVYKKAYIYPGLVQYDDADDYYYLPSWFKARINLDGTILNTSTDPVDGYPLADQWNHAMRKPDEDALYAIHKQVNLNRGSETPEISLRMLLDRMNDPNDQSMTNTIVINLHGEMLPVLPLRNYSDAAKDPSYFWGGRGGALVNRAWRAVTHAERLAYTRLTGTAIPTTVALRVYAYDYNPPADPITVADEDDVINNVTLFIPGGKLANLKSMSRMRGNSRNSYYWLSQTAGVWNITGGAYHDGPTPASSNWVADEYSPPGRASGLRICLYGVTPTARVYGGAPN